MKRRKWLTTTPKEATMADTLTAAQVRNLMGGDDEYGNETPERINRTTGTTADDLLAGLALLRSWGKMYVNAEHEEVYVEFADDTLGLANRMGRHTLRTLGSLGWTFHVEMELFLFFT